MKYTKFKDEYIGTSAIEFFDKLAILESSDNYQMDKGYYYIGRYQMGIDILKDLNWIDKNSKNWNTAQFLETPKRKWGIRNKRDFLNCPQAQDEAVMLSIRARWQTIKKMNGSYNSTIKVPKESQYKRPNKHNVSYKEVQINLDKKKKSGYKVTGDYRGTNILLDPSGLVAGAHLCGQGAVLNAINNQFLGQYGIPVDGNNIPFLFYHENLKFYDLSVIIGVEPTKPKSIVLENKTKSDKEYIEKEANTKIYVDNSKVTAPQENTESKENSNTNNNNSNKNNNNNKNNSNTNNTSSTEKKSENNSPNQDISTNLINASDKSRDRLHEIQEKQENNRVVKNNHQNTNVYIFNGQSSEENNENTAYHKSQNNLNESVNVPKKVFIHENKDILLNLHFKFNSPNHYNKDFILFLETKTNKKVYEKDREIIFNILKQYNYFIGREEIEIDDKTKKPIIIEISYFIAQTNFDFFRGQNFSDETIKLQDIILFLLHQFGNGIIHLKDIEDILKSSNISIKTLQFYIPFRERDKWINDSCYKIVMYLDNMDFFDLISQLNQFNEQSVYSYPYLKDILDRMFIEFIKVQTRFKQEKEIKHYDNYENYSDNILNSFFISMIYRVKKYFFLENSPFYLFNYLIELGENTRITTFLEKLILNKNYLTKVFIFYLFKWKQDAYSDYYCAENGNDNFRKEDNEIIHRLFESSKNLLDFSINKETLGVFTFYEEFFDVENEFNQKNKYFVNNRCLLKCTCGTKYSLFEKKENSVYTEQSTQMTISDIKICPFAKCSNIKICKPQLVGKWNQSDKNTLINNDPALISDASITCAHGGVVTIDKPGQNVVDIVEMKEEISSDPIIDEQYCSYKNIFSFSDKINEKFMQTDVKKKLVKYRKNKKSLTNLKAKKNLTQSEKKQIINLETATSDSIKNKLKDIIWSEFTSSCDYINNNAFPTIDNYNFTSKSGSLLCHHRNKELYSAYLLACIVYGYLNEAGNLNVANTEKEKIKKYLNNKGNNKNKEDKKYDYTQSENSSFYLSENNSNYSMGNDSFNSNYSSEFIKNVKEELKEFVNIKKYEIDISTSKKTQVSDEIISTGISIGSKLYNSIREIPNQNTITSFINKNSKPLHYCPLSDEKRKELCPYAVKDGERFAPWVDIAYEELKKYGKYIEEQEPLASKVREYHKVGGNNSSYDSSVPWCASFVNWCLNKSNFKNWKSASSLAALKSKEMKIVNEELFGGILVLSKPNNINGHVGFIVGQTPDLKSYVCLGGNQSNKIKLSTFSKTPTKSFSKVSIVLPEDYEYTEAQYLNENDIIDIKKEEERTV